MSSAFGSAGSLSRSAGGLAAGLQQRNRYWIQFLDERIAALEGKMRASGDSGAPAAADIRRRTPRGAPRRSLPGAGRARTTRRRIRTGRTPDAGAARAPAGAGRRRPAAGRRAGGRRARPGARPAAGSPCCCGSATLWRDPWSSRRRSTACATTIPRRRRSRTRRAPARCCARWSGGAGGSTCTGAATRVTSRSTSRRARRSTRPSWACWARSGRAPSRSARAPRPHSRRTSGRSIARRRRVRGPARRRVRLCRPVADPARAPAAVWVHLQPAGAALPARAAAGSAPGGRRAGLIARLARAYPFAGSRPDSAGGRPRRAHGLPAAPGWAVRWPRTDPFLALDAAAAWFWPPPAAYHAPARAWALGRAVQGGAGGIGLDLDRPAWGPRADPGRGHRRPPGDRAGAADAGGGRRLGARRGRPRRRAGRAALRADAGRNAAAGGADRPARAGERGAARPARGHGRPARRAGRGAGAAVRARHAATGLSALSCPAGAGARDPRAGVRDRRGGMSRCSCWRITGRGCASSRRRPCRKRPRSTPPGARWTVSGPGSRRRRPRGARRPARSAPR